jgi:ATP-binding cassette subfamily F protein 3
LLAGLGDTGLNPADRAEQGRRVKALADEIETLEQRWLELGEALDALNGG